jgi:precorrin-3B methylase
MIEQKNYLLMGCTKSKQKINKVRKLSKAGNKCSIVSTGDIEVGFLKNT